MELVEHRVRFGEVGPGRLLHHTRVLHMLIVGCQVLAERLDDPFDDIVAAGGVPHMPVAVRAAFDRYPRYGETVTLYGTPVEVGETSLTVRYVLRRTDGSRLAVATVIHVTVGADGSPQRVPDVIREQVDAGAVDVPAVGHDLSPEATDVGDAPFGHWFTVRSAQLEAVGGAYFEEYFRAISRALEAHLEDRGPSLDERAGAVVPFVPTGLAFEFQRPIMFEDAIAVEGRLDAGADPVTGHYRLRGEEATRLHGVVTYGCTDEAGELTGFPAGALEGLR